MKLTPLHVKVIKEQKRIQSPKHNPPLQDDDDKHIHQVSLGTIYLIIFKFKY